MSRKIRLLLQFNSTAVEFTPLHIRSRCQSDTMAGGALITVFVLLSLSTTAFLQTNEDSGKQNYDPSYLEEKEKQIDRFIENRQYGTAYELARKVRKQLADTDRSDDAADLYNSVLEGVKKNYKQVMKRVDRSVNVRSPYEAYQTLDQAVTNFEGTGVWEEKLRERKQSMKVKVVEAHRKGQLDEVPSFIPENTTNRNEANQNRASSSKGKRTTDTESEEAGSERPSEHNSAEDEQEVANEEYPSPYTGTTGKQIEFLKSNVKFIRKAYQHIENQQWDQAVQLLSSIRNTLGKPRVPAIESLMAKLLLKNDYVEKADEFVHPYGSLLDGNGYNKRLQRAYFWEGKVRHRKKLHRKAIMIQQNILEKGAGLIRALAGEEAGVLLQKMATDVSGYRKARDSFQFALKVIDHLKQQLKQESSAGDEQGKGKEGIREVDVFKAMNVKEKDILTPIENQHLSRHEHRIRNRLKRADRMLDIMEHGLGFYLYRKARRLQDNKKWQRSLDVWNKLIEKGEEKKGNGKDLDQLLSTNERVSMKQLKEALSVAPVYRKAARYYKREVQLEMGNYKQAYRGLKKFIKEGKKFQLYGGAARQLKADVMLEYMYRPDKAIPLYTKALEWFNEVEKRDEAVEGFTVPEKAERVTEPPKKFRGVTGWGNVVWRTGGPADVFNRNTADYYLDYHRMIAKTHRSLCYFIKSIFERNEAYRKKAMDDIKIINEVDQQSKRLTEQHRPSNYLRLKDGYSKGKLFASKDELRHFDRNKKMLAALLVADFHYEIERWEDAKTSYQRLVKRFGAGSLKNFTIHRRAYLHFVLALCHIATGQEEKGITMLRRFDEQFRHTATWPRARIVYAKQADFKERLRILRTVYRERSSDPMGRLALQTLGEVFIASNMYNKARKVFRKLKRESTNANRVEIAESWLDHIGSKQ